MTKKSYVKPNMEIMDMPVECALLAGSGEEGNPYWEGPAKFQKAASPTGGVANEVTDDTD